MVRFAVAVTAIMLALTALAVFWITRIEAPVSEEYLKPDDLRAIGLKPTNWRSQRYFLPMAVTSYHYSCELEEAWTAIGGEVRIGESGTPYDEALRQERANSKNPRPPENTYVVKISPLGPSVATYHFISLRAYPRPQGGEVSAEVWMRDGSNFIHSRVAETEVPPEKIAERRDWCERKAGTIALIMLGQVRDAQSK